MRRLLTLLLLVLSTVVVGAQDARDLKLVLVQSKPAEVAAKGVPRGYALIVGVAQYPTLPADKQLRFPESDAEAMYRVLISKEGGAFPAENVHLLKGRDATLENIRREIEEWLPKVAQPQDRVVVYFAGHGFVTEGKGYFAPSNVDLSRLKETAYPMATLGDVLANKVKAEWKVLLSDACHSGKINAETTDDALEREFRALPRGFLNLTATTGSQQSFEDPTLSTGFGFFTYFLVEAWRGAADSDPCDGKITADELVAYVGENVRRYARARQLTQAPQARGDYEPDMLLGTAQGCLKNEGPSTEGTAIVEANLDDVDLYIDGTLIGKVSKDKPLRVPGLKSGLREFRGERSGYEPDRQQIMIAPNQETTVTLRIRYIRQVNKAAMDLNAQGEKLLFTRRSSMSLMNLVPMERRQSETDLKRAAELFERALKEDPNYATPAYHLGQTYQLLLNGAESVKYFKRAIEIDGTHIAARTECAAALIEQGDADEAIRQLTEVLRLEPKNDQALSMIARAYWDKAAWLQAIDYADRAIALNVSNAQAHLWKADALRQLAAAEKDPQKALPWYADAREDYRAFLDLTNFSTGLGSRLAFQFIGFGIGSRRHADRQGAYDSLRSAGFLGLCMAEAKVGNQLRALEYCKRGLKHAPNSPIAFFLVGGANRDIFNDRGDCRYLKAARANYATMLQINSDLVESGWARQIVSSIDTVAPQVGCKT